MKDLKSNSELSVQRFERLKQSINGHLDISADEFELQCNFFKSHHYQAKEVILSQGEICREQRFITKGLLKAYHIDTYGKEYVQLFGFENWWMSDLASFITKTPSSLTIQAIEETEVLYITFDNFNSLLKEHAILEKYFRILFQNAFAAQQKKVMQLISNSVNERYDHFLNVYSRHINRIPQKDIASFIGSTPEHLSYLRKQRATKK